MFIITLSITHSSGNVDSMEFRRSTHEQAVSLAKRFYDTSADDLNDGYLKSIYVAIEDRYQEEVVYE